MRCFPRHPWISMILVSSKISIQVQLKLIIAYIILNQVKYLRKELHMYIMRSDLHAGVMLVNFSSLLVCDTP
jgi:hypothetical protein